MAYTHVQTFNPEILYAFDPLNEAGNYSKTHSHNFLEISILLEGEADYLVDGERQELGTGAVMLFNPGVKHAERQKEGTVSHQLHIGLTNLSLNGLPRNHFPNKRALLDLGCYADAFMEKAWRVTKEFNEQRSEYQLMGKGLILEMLGLLLRSLEDGSDNTLPQALSQTAVRQQHLVNHAVYYLENHHSEEITLEQLAQQLFVSPAHLSKIFKEATGVSPIHYLIHVRLKHAKELLKQEEWTIKEVAQAVGYQDAYHFSKLFKKYYGTAPSQVAKEQRPV